MTRAKCFAAVLSVVAIGFGCSPRSTVGGSSAQATVVFLAVESGEKTVLTQLSPDGKLSSFDALPFASEGVSISTTGVVAQLQDQEVADNILLRLTSTSGKVNVEFTFDQRFSIPVSAPQVSPDGQSVAFGQLPSTPKS